MEFFRPERMGEDVLLVFIDNPGERVNMLSERMFSELAGLLGEIEADPSIKALVFMSAKDDNFIVGADIREFEKVARPEQSTEIIGRLHELFNRISGLPFPVVAALNGPCLGGGLEFALACHFRIATDSAKTILGLPEVTLGLLPAGGGTQRLTRLIGIRKALPLMLAGRTLDARRAKALGIVDLVVFPHDLADTALRCLPALGKRFPRKSPWPGAFTLDRLLRSVPQARKLYFGMVRRRIEKQTAGNYPAPFRLADCVEAGFAGTISEGFHAEAEAFGPLILSPQSKALRSLFFMQTALKKKDFGAPRPVELIGVLGGGFMGSGIAAVSAANGYRVALKDVSRENLSQALGAVWKHFDRQVRKRKGRPVERDKLYSLVVPTLDPGAFSRADLVIEAVFEDLGVKHRVVKEIEEHIPPTCIVASNTSAIPISRIAEASKRPENVIGMHYFSPVTKMPLLEVIVTERCADWVLATAVAVGRRQGKTVIVVKDGPGFYTSRILMPYTIEAIRLVAEGAPVRDVDEAMRRFGFPVGPLRLMDEVGLEVAAHVASEMEDFFTDRDLHVPPALGGIVKSGFSGKKNGLGFYDYRPRPWEGLKIPGFEPPRPVNSKIYNSFAGRREKRIEFAEIQARLVYLMVNEAALCLQEGILSSPEDGDIGAVFGLGFPPFLGGPFRYLDAHGAGRTVSEMEDLAARLGPRFEPAPILAHMAEHEDKFYKTD
ncbi:MAG: 3-hydroxyacyl-CoA dehydrogenase NAD-binding domain-containing protein [Syntrophobacteraceae bacterium]